MTDNKTILGSNGRRIALIAVLLGIAIFGIYRYTVASGLSAQAASNGPVATDGSGQVASSGSSAASAGGGCCSAGGSSAQSQGTAELSGEVQKITVNVGPSGYEPNSIKLKAGVPAEITFGQSGGCTGYVQSQQLNFGVDVSSGPQIVKLAGLQPGTYGFACGMGMVTGQIVVE